MARKGFQLLIGAEPVGQGQRLLRVALRIVDSLHQTFMIRIFWD